MSDFYYRSRECMISTMQYSMRQIRQILNIGVQELADIIGVTRQTINNIENGKNKLSTVQYIAFCAVIDHLVSKQNLSYDMISAVLENNKVKNDTNIYVGDVTMLQRFFSVFSDASKLVGDPFDHVGSDGSKNYDSLFVNYKFFLDHTALCDDKFDAFLYATGNMLQKSDSRFIVPFIVIENIQRDCLSDEYNRSDRAKKAMFRLKNMQNKDMILIKGEESDKDIANTFVSVFAKFKKIHRLALITQNEALAEKISRLNDFLSGFEILVVRITDNGRLLKWKKSESGESVQEEIGHDEHLSDFDRVLIDWEFI